MIDRIFESREEITTKTQRAQRRDKKSLCPLCLYGYYDLISAMLFGKEIWTEERIINTMRIEIFFLSFLLFYPNSFTSLSPSYFSQGQNYKDEISAKIELLYPILKGKTICGPSIDTQRRVEDFLLSLASKSPEARREVIQALLSKLNDLSKSEKLYYFDLWYCTFHVLGKLKAIEAINLCVKYLDYNDGIMGLSLGHYPATRTLVDIGKPAVPALVKVLIESDKPIVRANAARALGEIGGDEAKEGLQSAYQKETDQGVLFHIQRYLEIFSSK